MACLMFETSPLGSSLAHFPQLMENPANMFTPAEPGSAWDPGTLQDSLKARSGSSQCLPLSSLSFCSNISEFDVRRQKLW
jgi:hypothetical protein